MRNHIYSAYLKVIAFVAFGLMAFGQPAVAQWSAPRSLFTGTAIPEPGPFWLSPVIAAEKDPSGTIHLVWTNKVTDERNVLASASYANGAWSPMVELPTDANTSSMLPSIAISADGMLHVTYTSFRPDGSWGIMYQNKPQGGNWSQPTLVSGSEYLFNAYSQLFLDAQQQPHVIYVGYADNGETTVLKHVKFSTANPAQVQQLDVPANSTGSFNPRVVKSADGNIECFWYNGTDENRSLQHASYDGAAWSTTLTLASSQNSSFMDESAVVAVATPASEVYAIWYNMEQETGAYRNLVPGQGWGSIETINDPAFVMGSGLSDSQGFIHMAGNVNDNVNEVYDLKYHQFNGTQWTHEVIEQPAAATLTAFPALAINGDTLFCFYAKINESGASELTMSYRILDHLTPVTHVPLNKEIAVKVSPNPFHSSSVISFNAMRKGEVQFLLTDALGRTETARMQVQETGLNAINFYSLFPRYHRKGVFVLSVQTPYGYDNVTLVK